MIPRNRLAGRMFDSAELSDIGRSCLRNVPPRGRSSPGHDIPPRKRPEIALCESVFLVSGEL